MQKKSLIIFLLISAISVFAQINAPNTMTKKELITQKIDKEIAKSTVIEYLKKCVYDISKGKNNQALKTEDYIPYRIRIKSFVNYRWLTADTGLSHKWIKDVYDLLEYMYKTRDIIETAIHNKQTQTAKTQQAIKYYDVAYKRFVNLVQNPIEVPSKVRRQLQVKKVLWQKAMRKKYKIEK